MFNPGTQDCLWLTVVSDEVSSNIDPAKVMESNMMFFQAFFLTIDTIFKGLAGVTVFHSMSMSTQSPGRSKYHLT